VVWTGPSLWEAQDADAGICIFVYPGCQGEKIEKQVLRFFKRLILLCEMGLMHWRDAGEFWL
jgi:hypothetical protein